LLRTEDHGKIYIHKSVFSKPASAVSNPRSGLASVSKPRSGLASVSKPRSGLSSGNAAGVNGL
jgi:hypothetical protein